MEYWNGGMMGWNGLFDKEFIFVYYPNVPSFHYSMLHRENQWLPKELYINKL